MIIRCWGIVNSTNIEFSPMEERPGYWSGIAPWQPGLQDIEIWAENDKGAIGHVNVQVGLTYLDKDKTLVRLVLCPFTVKVLLDKDNLLYYGGRNKQLEESVTFLFGEHRKVSIQIDSVHHIPFPVTNAKWTLKEHGSDNVEAEGDCDTTEVRMNRWVCTALIRPLKPSSYYKLYFAYDIGDEHFVKPVGVRTSEFIPGGQNGK